MSMLGMLSRYLTKMFFGDVDANLVVLEPFNDETVRDHPHKKFEIAVGSLERQRLVHQSYRLCPFHKLTNVNRKLEGLHDGEKGCQCCYERKYCLLMPLIFFDSFLGAKPSRFREGCEDVFLSAVRDDFVRFMLREWGAEPST